MYSTVQSMSWSGGGRPRPQSAHSPSTRTSHTHNVRPAFIFVMVHPLAPPPHISPSLLLSLTSGLRTYAVLIHSPATASNNRTASRKFDIFMTTQIIINNLLVVLSSLLSFRCLQATIPLRPRSAVPANRTRSFLKEYKTSVNSPVSNDYFERKST